MARKGWDLLAPSTQQRYERGGVNRGAYEGGASLASARGHAPIVTTDRTYTDRDISKLVASMDVGDTKFGRYVEGRGSKPGHTVEMTPGQVIRAGLRDGLSLAEIKAGIDARKAGDKEALKRMYDAKAPGLTRGAQSVFWYH